MGISSQVTKSNVFSQSYINVFNLLNLRTNVKDPRGTIQRKMFYKRYPSVKDRSFQDYPFIVLFPINSTVINRVFDTTRADNEIRIEGEVVSSNRMDGDKNSGKGAEYLDSLCNNMFETLMDASNKTTLRGYNMANIDLSFDDTDSDTREGISVFVRSFTISFKTRMVISS